MIFSILYIYSTVAKKVLYIAESSLSLHFGNVICGVLYDLQNAIILIRKFKHCKIQLTTYSFKSHIKQCDFPAEGVEEGCWLLRFFYEKKAFR